MIKMHVVGEAILMNTHNIRFYGANGKLSLNHGHQSIFFIAYTNGTIFCVSFQRTKFRNQTMLYVETLVAVLNISVSFQCICNYTVENVLTWRNDHFSSLQHGF